MLANGDATDLSTVLRYRGYGDSNTLIHSTIPFKFNTQQVATDGHACVFANGCEQFGLAYFGNATSVRYQ